MTKVTVSTSNVGIKTSVHLAVDEKSYILALSPNAVDDGFISLFDCGRQKHLYLTASQLITMIKSQPTED